MISLFKKSNAVLQDFKNHLDNYGDYIVHPLTCDNHGVKNGEMTLEVKLDKMVDTFWADVDTGDCFAVPVPWSKHRQLFRVYDYDRESDLTATYYARHVYFDLAGYTLIDTRPTNKTASEALSIILTGTPFTGHSNLTTASTAYYVRMKITAALGSDDDNSFIKRWGGERLCDNFDLYINEQIGSDDGVQILYGKNLSAITMSKNEDDVVTRIIPVGFDGIMLDGDSPWVDSPLIGSYPTRHDAEVKFDDVKFDAADEDAFKTLAEAQAELKKRAEALFTDGADKPKYTYKISMVDLRRLDAYKDFVALEDVGLGDTVTAKHDEMGVEVKTRVIEYNYDCITESYKDLTLDTVQGSYFDDTSDTNSAIQAILNSDGTVNANVLSGVINSFKSKIKAQRNVEQKSNVRAILFEDLIEGSPTYGAMSFGTQGFAIADTMLPDGSDWDWRTFGTAKGFVADLIVAGRLMGVSVDINLETGLILMGVRDSSGVISSPVFKLALTTTSGVSTANLEISGIINQYAANGYKSLEISDSEVKFYSPKDSGNYVGSIFADKLRAAGTKQCLRLIHDAGDELRIGYADSGSSTGYSTDIAIDSTSVTIYNDLRLPAKSVFCNFLACDNGWLVLQSNNRIACQNLSNTGMVPIYASEFHGAVVCSDGWVVLNSNDRVACQNLANTAYVEILASNITSSSLEKFKQDIEPLCTRDALDILRKSDFFEYRLKQDVKRGISKVNAGLVIGEGYNTPNLLQNAHHDGIDLYTLASVTAAAVKELDARVTALEEKETEK